MNIYCEFTKLVSKANNGIILSSKEYDTLKTKLTNVELTSLKASQKLKKDIGFYSTIFCEEYNYLTNEGFNFISSLLSSEIKKIINKELASNPHPKYFIVGLGNSSITADSLGVKVTNKIISTSINLKNGNLSSNNFGDVFSLSPSVASKNGIYTLTIIKAIVKELKPDAIIIIDSLSCKNIKNICRTFQVNNCGLTPGCEIGNKQPKIDKSNLKIPVISVGCPVVTNLSNIVKKPAYDHILTLKDIDIAINRLADIISFAINKVVHPKLKDEEIIFLSNN